MKLLRKEFTLSNNLTMSETIVVQVVGGVIAIAVTYVGWKIWSRAFSDVLTG
jgi:hypothetical protein